MRRVSVSNAAARSGWATSKLALRVEAHRHPGRLHRAERAQHPTGRVLGAADHTGHEPQQVHADPDRVDAHGPTTSANAAAVADCGAIPPEGGGPLGSRHAQGRRRARRRRAPCAGRRRARRRRRGRRAPPRHPPPRRARSRPRSPPACRAPSPRARAARTPPTCSGSRRRPPRPAARACRGSDTKPRSMIRRLPASPGRRRRPNRWHRPARSPRRRAAPAPLAAARPGSCAARRCRGAARSDRAARSRRAQLVDGGGGHRHGTHPEGHHAEPVRFDARCLGIRPGRLRRAQHQVGIARLIRSPGALEEVAPVAGELTGVAREREVVHRHHDRHGARRHRQPGHVDHVDRPGCPFDGRTTCEVPRLVERPPWQTRWRRGSSASTATGPVCGGGPLPRRARVVAAHPARRPRLARPAHRRSRAPPARSHRGPGASTVRG